MNIAICDDEKQFTEQLHRQISDYCLSRHLDCKCYKFFSSEELLHADLSMMDVLFLDIQMPGQNGLETAKILRQTLPDLLLVFITSLIEYAPYGYHVSAFRYLLKYSLNTELIPCMDAILTQLHSPKTNKMLELSNEDGIFRIAISHIIYFEGSSGRKILLHTVDSRKQQKNTLYRGKLSELEAELSEQGFIRIQRSFLVNMQHIIEIKNHTVFLDSGETLSTSRQIYNQLKSQYILWKVNQS